MDEIDRILSTDEVIRPSAGFSTRVMRTVREEDEQPAPMEFPWSRLLPGLVTSLALTLAGLLALGRLEETAPAIAPTLSAAWLGDPTVRGVLWATAALLGSGLLAWAAARLGGGRRSPGF